jgi:hypothetical protein
MRRHYSEETERGLRSDLEMAQKELYEEEQRLETAKDELMHVQEEFARRCVG